MKTPLRMAVLIFIFLGFLHAQDPFNAPTNLPSSDSNISTAVAFADFDNDGWVDLYISKANDIGGGTYPNYLYRNNSGTLAQLSISGVTDINLASGTASWADVDNDGFLDLYVAGARPSFFGSTPNNNLFINDGAGSFTDETGNSTYGAITTEAENSRHVGFGDYNNDGYPDAYVDNNGPISGQGNNSFFENDGDGTFTRLGESTLGNIVWEGSTGEFTTFGSGFGWSDFNNDGYLDIYNCGGGGALSNKLWQNDPVGGDFNEVTPGEMQPTQTSFLTCSWGDFDNDGDLDLFAANMIDGAVHYNYLYENNSTLSTVSFDSLQGIGPIVTDTYEAVGSTWGDVDNDGDLDIFVSNRPDNQQSNIPSTMYLNNGFASGYTFSKAADYFDPSSGDNYGGRGVAFADLDNDGFLDLVAAREGFPLLYTNLANNGNGYTIVKLRGTGTTNTHALGSRARVVANIPEQSGQRSLLREVSGQTGSAQNSLRAHFGIGTATKIDTLEAQWLNSTGGSGRTSNTYTDLPVNKFMVFKEGTTTGSASVIDDQNFLYLIGNSGAAVEFESNTGSGTLTITRTDSDPGSNGYNNSATAPDATTITPNIVASEKYWTISQSGISSFTAEVYLDISGISGISNPDKLLILSRPNSSTGWTAHNTLRIGNTLYTDTNISTLSSTEFAIGTNSTDNSLPVELAAFKAISGDASVALEWATASELNNQGFILERSADKDRGYSEIASYKYNEQLKGQGNSSAEHNYRFVDNSIVNGRTYYYRLSDVSNDGLRTYHGSVEARPMQIISNFELHPNYPNPFNPSTKIAVDIPLTENALRTVLSVYNARGQKVREVFSGQLSGGSHNFSWDGKNSFGEELSSGVYFFLLRSGDYTASRKMLLIR